MTTPFENFSIADDVRPMVRLAQVSALPVRVQPSNSDLVGEIASVCEAMRQAHSGKTAGEIEAIRPARVLYKSFGIDPTKTRPSSEALLRRILKGGDFPSVNNAVDLCNLCALRSLLPLGLYDADKVCGPAVFRRGHPDEEYAGIRKGAVRVAGRPAFADDEGAFGNPTSDSLRTCVDEGTSAVWMVYMAPAEFSMAELEKHAQYAADQMRRFLAVDDGASVQHAVVE